MSYPITILDYRADIRKGPLEEKNNHLMDRILGTCPLCSPHEVAAERYSRGVNSPNAIGPTRHLANRLSHERMHCAYNLLQKLACNLRNRTAAIATITIVMSFENVPENLASYLELRVFWPVLSYLSNRDKSLIPSFLSTNSLYSLFRIHVPSIYFPASAFMPPSCF